MGRYADNLEEFLDRMEERGFTVKAVSSPYAGKIDVDVENTCAVAYQALNYEDTNIRLWNEKSQYGQTVSVFLTGDKWCDIVPVADWSVPKDNPDIVNEVIKELREELLGEDA